MNQEKQQKSINSTGDVSIMDVISGIKSMKNYIKSKWLIVLIAAVAGALLGLCYSIIKKTTYTAVCTFVLEDSKSSGGIGQYAGIASLAGINLGGGDNGNIFEGDNILELYKSRIMIERALLSACNFDGKKVSLIDRYIKFNHIDLKELSNVNFSGDPGTFNRQQDSIITNIVDVFNKSVLNVSRPDKKLSIIKVEVVTKDELFSKYFTEKLVQNVNDFYVQTKTKKEYQNIIVLQHQADSVKAILNSSINGVASSIDASPNANPQLALLRVPSQKKQVDVQANSAIYGEMIKNLELAKISYRQETPLIQVIDEPVLPLKKEFVGKIKGLVIGSVLLSIFAIIWLVATKFLKAIL